MYQAKYESFPAAVSREQYTSERGDRAALDEVVMGADHTLRVIMNPLLIKRYAADIKVTVDEIRPVRRRLIVPYLLGRFAEVDFLRLNNQSEVEDNQPFNMLINIDGRVLGNWFSVVHLEAGYLLRRGPDFEQNPMESTSRSPDLDLVPA